MKKVILKRISILLVRYLQRRYKRLSLKSRYCQSNQNILQLTLIQYVLYFFKQQFKAWGYFHPSCGWRERDEIEFNKLFPVKDFEEIDIVVCQNPEAMTYYHNLIFRSRGWGVEEHAREIKKQLKKWDKWN